MSTFFKSFFGKIIATLFIAICAALGFGPEILANYLITNAPNWVTPRIAQYSFLTLGSLAFTIISWNKIAHLIAVLSQRLENILNGFKWIDGPHSIHSFGYVISKPHDLALAGGIRLKGLNTRKSSLIIKRSYLKSLVTGEEIEAEIENLKAENVEICANSNFSLWVKFQNEDGHLAENSISGIKFENFLKRFSCFKIIIETDKKTHEIEFGCKETKEWVSLIHSGLMMPAPSEKARVLKAAGEKI
jgi:hypothetical protein